MSEREAVVSAINTSKNLGVAAHKLGASRRTLQNRMRFYGLPRGRSGRPKESLPKRSSGTSMIIGPTDLLLLGGVGVALYFAGRWMRRSTSQVAGAASLSVGAYLRGVDAQIASNRYLTGSLVLAVK